MSQPNDRDKWINLSVIHEKEVYDLQGKVAALKAENKRLRKAGNAMANCINEFRMGRWCNALDYVGGFRVWLNWKKAQATYLKGKEPLTKHEDDIRRGLRKK